MDKTSLEMTEMLIFFIIIGLLIYFMLCNPVFSLGFILGMLHKRIWNLITAGIDKIHEGRKSL